MQNAKDSFYGVLRDRLAGINPDRTVAVRGIVRPAIVVDENETESVAHLLECFHLRWTDVKVNYGPMMTAALQCEITYTTAGNAWNGGLDRGRVLATLDAELLACVGAQPQNAAKNDYSGLASGAAIKSCQAKIWWSDLQPRPAETKGDCLRRTATVQVMTYQEAGEL